MPRRVPENPLAFIRSTLKSGRIFWTYHVGMRLKERFIPRETILNAVDTFEVIESYPDDKYLPSYLIRGEWDGDPFHVHVAVDLESENVRVVTAYRPDASKWETDFRRRRREP